MRRSIFGFVSITLLAVLLVTPGFMQDRPGGGLPVKLAMEMSGCPDPWFVAMKPAYLKVVAVDQYGLPCAANGVVVVMDTSDPRSKLNKREVTLNGGTCAVKVQWFTSGEHSINASSKTGLQGRLSGIKVKDLPKDLKVEVEPKPWPKYAWAGGAFRLKTKVTVNDEPIEYLEVSVRTSKGVRRSPYQHYTDEAGTTSGIIFPPGFICPGDEGGGGGVDGDMPMDVDVFIDANGNGTFDDTEPGDDEPPIIIVEACPQVLIPTALEMLRILEAGGSIEPPPVEDGIVVSGASAATGKETSDLAKITAARRFLEEQVVQFVEEGKWKGRFSQVRTRLEAVETLLSGVLAAQPIIQRLDCSRHIMSGLPDVKGQRLDKQAKPGKPVEVAVGGSDQFRVLNLGSGGALLEDGVFGRCFTPSVVSADTKGPGVASIGDPEDTTVDYDCTGMGRVRLRTTTQFSPKLVIVIPPPGDGVVTSVSAAAVAYPAEEIGSMNFILLTTFAVAQIVLDLDWESIISDQHEATPNRTRWVVKNGDDDNHDGVADIDQTNVTQILGNPHSENENNLAQLRIRIEGIEDGVVELTKFRVAEAAGDARLWKTPTKNAGTEVGLDAAGKAVLDVKRDLKPVGRGGRTGREIDLFVEGVKESSFMGDIAFVLSRPGVAVNDVVELTVVWISQITLRSSANTEASPDNGARTFYAKTAAPPSTKLGERLLFADRIGIGIEFVGEVIPPGFVPFPNGHPVLLDRDVAAIELIDAADGSTPVASIDFTGPNKFVLVRSVPAFGPVRGNDSSPGDFLDTLQTSGNSPGVVYDLDAPGTDIGFDPAGVPFPAGTVSRIRANFREFAVIVDQRGVRHRASDFRSYSFAMSNSLSGTEIARARLAAAADTITVDGANFAANELQGSVIEVRDPGLPAAREFQRRVIAENGGVGGRVIKVSPAWRNVPGAGSTVVITRPSSWTEKTDVPGDNRVRVDKFIELKKTITEKDPD